MNQKRLIPIMLVVIMIINCLVPVASVFAASKTKEQKLSQLNMSNPSSVTNLDLSDCEIKDLNDIKDQLLRFTNITHLDLSGNELTKNSHLDVLDELISGITRRIEGNEFLTVDLSNNHLDALGYFEKNEWIGIKEETFYDDNVVYILHSQTVTNVTVVNVDEAEEIDSEHVAVTIELPQILIAENNITDVANECITISSTDEEEDISDGIDTTSSYYEPIKTRAVVKGYFEQVTGKLRLEGEIAKVSILIPNESRFTLKHTEINEAYAVLDENQRMTSFEDDNLYIALKKQFTAGANNFNDALRTYNNSSAKNLYVKCDDESNSFIFNMADLKENMPIIKADGWQVRKLGGIEVFVGTKELYLNDNYIDSFDKLNLLIETQQKEEDEAQKAFDEKIKEFIGEEGYLEVLALFKELNDVKMTTTTTGTISITTPGGTQIVETTETREERIQNLETQLRNKIEELSLSILFNELYDIDSEYYKALSILTPELLLNKDVYYGEEDAVTIALLSDEVERIARLRDSGALRPAEVAALKSEFSDIFDADETELTDYAIVERIVKSINAAIRSSRRPTQEEISGYIDKFYNVANTFDTYNRNVVNGTATRPNNPLEYDWPSLMKLVALTEEELNEFVTIQKMKRLDISHNQIPNIDGIDGFDDLEYLNAGDNKINSISNIAWPKLNKLVELDLHGNIISDISPINKVLPRLEILNLSNNYISNALDKDNNFMINGTKLTDVDFSYNRLTDLTGLMAQYAAAVNKRNQNRVETLQKEYTMGEYWREETDLDIKLDHQVLDLIVSNSTTNINGTPYIFAELPPIFSQFEKIDPDNTEFGLVNVIGSVTADGARVALNANFDTGIVNIKENDSYGDGTICYIKYNTVEVKFGEVKISDSIGETYEPGKKYTLSGSVIGADAGVDTKIKWSIDNEGDMRDPSTRIVEENGNSVLQVGPNETAKKIIIRASTVASGFATKTLKIVEQDEITIDSIKITQAENKTTALRKEKIQFGYDVFDKDGNSIKNQLNQPLVVDWTFERKINDDDGTSINEITGKLSVGENAREGNVITVKASVRGTRLNDTYEIKVLNGEYEEDQNGNGGTNPGNTTPGNTTPGNTTPGNTTPGNPDNPPVVPTVTLNKRVSASGNCIIEPIPTATIKYFKDTVVGSSDRNKITVTDAAGNTITDETLPLKTGMKLSVDNKQYSISKLGDVNSDGDAVQLDSNMIKAYRLGLLERPFTEAEQVAADINVDGKTNRIDSYLLLMYRSKKDSTVDPFRDFTEESISKLFK